MRGGDVAGGQLDLLLLTIISGLGNAHGYAIIAALRERSDGTFDLAEGSVYPALQRLERQGLLHSGWVEGDRRPRRVYRLTAAGRRELVQQRARWQAVVTGVDRVVKWAQ